MRTRFGSTAYDYVIAGAGSAGCTLANRLSEDAGARVLLLEAGGWDRDPLIHIPLGWGRILQKRLHDWMYYCEPEESLAGRRVECARGKVVGGSSSTNAMVYVRGNRGDYDRWAASLATSRSSGPGAARPTKSASTAGRANGRDWRRRNRWLPPLFWLPPALATADPPPPQPPR